MEILQEHYKACKKEPCQHMEMDTEIPAKENIFDKKQGF